MAPTRHVGRVDPVEDFSQKVAYMADSNNAPDIAALIKELVQSNRDAAESHAAAIQPARMPFFWQTVVIGIIVTLVVSIPSFFITIGSYQNRLTNLENAHPEGLSALATEVHLLSAQQAEMQRRLNDFLDRESRK